MSTDVIKYKCENKIKQIINKNMMKNTDAYFNEDLDNPQPKLILKSKKQLHKMMN